MKQTEDFLHVQMFGNFQMKYGGKPLTGEKRRDTYFTSLMQILLHNVKKGRQQRCSGRHTAGRQGY